MTIQDRVLRAESIIVEHMYDNSHDEALTDILTDLRHWCNSWGVDFHRALEWAYEHYCAERREEGLE